MRTNIRPIFAILLAAQITGCSILNQSGLSTANILHLVNEKEAGSNNAARSEGSESKIANPPARTIRFDGHEIVLGKADNEVLETEKLVSMLNPLVVEQKFQSATDLILRHRETAERLLAECWAKSSDDPVVRLAAIVLSKRTTNAESNWNSLLKLASVEKTLALRYQELRNTFAEELQANDPSNERAAQLQQASQKLNHPLVRIDALRLLGLRELVAGRDSWAESLCRQAAETATNSGHQLLASELWLTVAEASRRSGQMSTASSAWSTAISQHLSACRKDQPLDVSFWLLADHTRPESIDWPGDLKKVLLPYAETIGCSLDGRSEMILWASIAQSQFERSELQLALVNFKKAETMVEGDSVMWLRIAQAKCLAEMGQAAAAAAILSGPAASSEPNISAAATAAMGSIKLQAGAYQQGAQLLHKAVTQSPATTWPGKNQALVDLAIAQLIIGDTEPGLNALHSAQVQLEKSGERKLLVQSLENESRLLEHEHRENEVVAIRSRITKLERLQP